MTFSERLPLGTVSGSAAPGGNHPVAGSGGRNEPAFTSLVKRFEQKYVAVEPDDRIHKAPPGPNRKDFRSRTPLGFARAVCAANHASSPASR